MARRRTVKKSAASDTPPPESTEDTGEGAEEPAVKRRIKPKTRIDRVIRGPVLDKVRKDLDGANITDVGGSLTVRGIPLFDKLALAYLLGVDVLPLRRSIALLGAQKSGKSQLGWIFLNMVLEYGGTGLFIDVEKKNSPEQIIALLGGKEQFEEKRHAFFRSTETSIEDIAQDVEKWIEQLQKVDAKMQMPRMIFLDSMGEILRAAEQEADASEQGGYDAARTAAVITRVLKKLENNYINAGPYLMSTVNHEKDKLGDGGKKGGPVGKTTGAGGKHKDFTASYIFSMKAMDKVSTQSRSRSLYIIKTRKASLTDTGRKIEIPVENWRDPESGEKRVDWQWSEALMNHLLGPKFPSKVLDELLGLKRVESTGCFAAPALGFKKGVPATEIETAIWDNPQVLNELYHHLDIMEGEVFDIEKPWPADER
jgi:RecA/RadA recombinase